MTNNSILENEINFNSLEKEIYAMGCKAARKVMVDFLEELDRQLMEQRDKGFLRHKGYKKGCIKTLMGEVEYTRAIYEVNAENAEKKHIYLLDEYMKFDCIGFISANLAERIADSACESSYAHTAENISRLTGQTISHTTAWNVVQKLGESIERQENECIKLNKENKLCGTRETKVLFEEADGVFVKLQGKHRSKGHKNSEIKLAIFHEGWKQTGTKRYELNEKTVICGIDSSKEFNARKEAQIAKKYNIDEIEQRIFNSDGGQWIKSMYKNDIDICYQLDPFHIRKAIKTSSPGGEYEKNILSFLKQGKTTEMFEYIETVADSLESAKSEEKVRKLYTYLYENRRGLMPYQKQIGKLPELNKGLAYRNMGNCEHNVYLTVAKRMKHRSSTWSQRGSLNLCKILCLRVSCRLANAIKNITATELPEHYTKETAQKIFSAGKTQKTAGKGYETKSCHLPLFDAAVTESIKGFKRMLWRLN